MEENLCHFKRIQSRCRYI